MGATTFQTKSTGKTIKEAYNSARENAEEEYGHQEGYNGTISTTTGYRDVTEEFNKSKYDDVYKYINSRFDHLNKRDCEAICLSKPVGNTNKVKSQVVHNVEKGTKKWILKYAVIVDSIPISKHMTKSEAIIAARLYIEKNNDKNVAIHMVKNLEKGSTLVATVIYKKGKNEKDGTWIFFGWAAE